MKYFYAILGFLLAVLKAILYQWALALAYLFRLITQAIARWRDLLRLPERLRKSPDQQCVRISDPAFKRPDPMIYDQYYLMKQGLAVTWDNPDIELLQGGLPVPSGSLLPNTDYEVVARVWNNSTEAPVKDMPVHFSYLSFGVATQSHPIGDTKIDLGVKGGPGHPAFAKMKWTTPGSTGHFCIQVVLEWLDDANPNNNLGQENVVVGVAHSPAEFEFQLRNDTDIRQAYRFEADGYAIPPLPPCDRRPDPSGRSQPPARQLPGTIAVIPPEHDRRNYPVPVGWTVSFVPADPVLTPGAEVTIRLLVTPPAGFTGRQPVNVHAFRGDVLAGGVSVFVERA
jgi:hypothetical protein